MNEQPSREGQNSITEEKQTANVRGSIPEEAFRYTFKAMEQREIERIRRKYAGEEEGQAPLQRLRALDRRVNEKASAAALIVGTVGALILGVGMCCTMVWSGVWFIPGIFIGLAGIAITTCAYPVYKAVLRTERKKVAPEILRLCKELEGKSPRS